MRSDHPGQRLHAARTHLRDVYRVLPGILARCANEIWGEEVSPYRTAPTPPPLSFWCRLGFHRWIVCLPVYTLVRMCGSGPVVRVRVTDDPEGTHWAWWDAEKREHKFVYAHRFLVAMCFPYGPEAEERRGRGKVMQVRVEVLGEARKEDLWAES